MLPFTSHLAVQSWYDLLICTPVQLGADANLCFTKTSAFVLQVGALEYDPDALAHSRHREWLSEKVIFREVVRIADVRLRAKIHQTYRMGYVKDAILPRALDDATFATLSSLMLFNNVEVPSAVCLSSASVWLQCGFLVALPT